MRWHRLMRRCGPGVVSALVVVTVTWGAFVNDRSSAARVAEIDKLINACPRDPNLPLDRSHPIFD